jgi:hypothetical protein
VFVWVNKIYCITDSGPENGKIIKGYWAGLEMKSGNGKLTREQKELNYSGMVIVCRSVEDAINAVR